jgi:hypothetical protein
MPIKNEITKILEKNLRYPEDKNLQQRGIADKIEEACNTIITKNFENVCKAKSRRSIEDINIGNVYIDHKTSDASLKFKMPNLISIDRLIKLDRELFYNFIIYSSEEKKILKVQVDKSLIELSAERAKLETLLHEIRELNKFISKNTGIIGFFTGTASKSVVAQKEKLLQELCSRNKIQQELVNKMYSVYMGLRNKHRQLKTTKQINNATNKFLFRAGINPYRNKPEIE